MKKRVSIFIIMALMLSTVFGYGSVFAQNTKPKSTKKVVKKQVVNVKKPQTVKTVSVDSAINGGVNWIKNQVNKGGYKVNDWYAITLGMAGIDVASDAFKKDGKTYVDFKNESLNGDIGKDKPVTNYAKYILGLAAVGKDPSYFGGHDLLQELAVRIEKGDDTITGQMWGMVALNSAGAIYDRDAAAKFLESKQNRDGGFGWMAGVPSDLDTTAMAAYALTSSGRSKNSASVKNALNYIKKSMKLFKKDKSKESVETLDQILMAAVSSKDDINQYRINDRGIVDEIMGYRCKDGGFSHVIKGNTDAFATYQTVTALLFYKNKKNMYSELAKNIRDAVAPVTADIRIEGPDKTILDENITLKDRIVYDNNGTAFDTKNITAYAFLMKALYKDGLSSVSDYGYGAPYVSTIDSLKGGKFGGWDGWMFLVNGADPGKGMTDVEIKNGDKILVFYGDYGILPLSVTVKSEAAVGENVVVNITSGGKPVKGAAVMADNTNMGVTDDNGNISIKFDKVGKYSIYAEKNDDKGKPVNIRSEKTIVNVK